MLVGMGASLQEGVVVARGMGMAGIVAKAADAAVHWKAHAPDIESNPSPEGDALGPPEGAGVAVLPTGSSTHLAYAKGVLEERCPGP